MQKGEWGKGTDVHTGPEIVCVLTKQRSKTLPFLVPQIEYSEAG